MYIFYLISSLKISNIVVLKLHCASEFLGGLLKSQISGLHCQSLIQWVWGEARECASLNKISGDADAGLGLHIKNHCSSTMCSIIGS